MFRPRRDSAHHSVFLWVDTDTLTRFLFIIFFFFFKRSNPPDIVLKRIMNRNFKLYIVRRERIHGTMNKKKKKNEKSNDEQNLISYFFTTNHNQYLNCAVAPLMAAHAFSDAASIYRFIICLRFSTRGYSPGRVSNNNYSVRTIHTGSSSLRFYPWL